MKYALNIDIENSGGFQNIKKGNEGNLFKGVANENITGCMPIYICEEHWGNAKFLMKSILGWITTLDPLGYFYK